MRKERCQYCGHEVKVKLIRKPKDRTIFFVFNLVFFVSTIVISQSIIEDRYGETMGWLAFMLFIAGYIWALLVNEAYPMLMGEEE